MRRLIAVAVAVTAGAACHPTADDGSCRGTNIDGVEVVTFGAADPIPCDVTPDQQLNIVYDGTGVEGWGGDASLEAATGDCLDAGGRPEWRPDARMICHDVDF